MKRHTKIVVALGALGVAGVLAAFAITPAAKAWAPDNLPPGWTVARTHAVGATFCVDSDRIFTAGRAQISDAFCEDSPTFQQDFDAWVNNHYAAPPTNTSTPSTTSTTLATTTAAATNTVVTATATEQTATTPVPPPTDTGVSTVTVTVTTTDTTLVSQIDALTAQLQALTGRVDRLEKAGDAAWLAFLDAASKGANPAAAAELARGTYLNAEYGLGAFAP